MTSSDRAATRPRPAVRSDASRPSGLLERVAEQSARMREAVPEAERKRWGQYPTSPTVARFLVGLVGDPRAGVVRVLDPGAGSGVLGVAMAEHLLQRGAERVELLAVEREPRARALLEESLAFVQGVLGPAFRHRVSADDVLELEDPRPGMHDLPAFDVVVANPPYFKMTPADRRGGDSPNAYTRFMEVGARLLRPGGRMCFIVPRSFASGPYFRGFRRDFHARMTLRRVHVFDSRRDAFEADGVLQENIIVVYDKCESSGGEVLVTSSRGSGDLDRPSGIHVPLVDVVDPRDRNAVLSLPTREDDLRLMRVVSGWASRLADFGLEISTGPVVPFRAKDVLRTAPGEDTVPLLWMQHVRPEGVVFPLPGPSSRDPGVKTFRKPQYIDAGASETLLVDNGTYVLLRRFSAKEETRRLTTAVLLRGQLEGRALGLENHLNFIHRPGGELEEEEARGLAALLRSASIDRYVRISNGSTQVNATEIRALPLPPLRAIRAIGSRLGRRGQDDADAAEVIREVLGVDG